MSLKITSGSINFRANNEDSSVDNREIKPSENNTLERQPSSDIVETKKNNTAKKLALGTIGLGTFAVIGDFAFAKGKHVKKILGIAEKEINKPAETKIEQTISDFKQKGGKFDKNKLMNNDGTPFSGKLMQEGKSGRKYIFEYKDGILQKSETFQKSVSGEIPLGTRSYTYNSNGKIESVIKDTIVMDKGNVKSVKKFEYNSDGKIKSVIDESKERIIDKPFETHFNYDSKGKLTSIRTKTDKFVNGKVKTVEETKGINGKGVNGKDSSKTGGNSGSSSKSSSGSSSSGSSSRSSGSSSSAGSHSSSSGSSTRGSRATSSSSGRSSASSSGSSASGARSSGHSSSSSSSGTSSTHSSGKPSGSSTAGGSRASGTKSGGKTSGKASGKTAEEVLQEQLDTLNSEKEELMAQLGNIMNIKYFIKDGKIMMEMVPTSAISTEIGEKVASEAPNAYKEKLKSLVKEFFETKLEGLKLEIPMEDVEKSKGKILEDFADELQSRIMSENAFNELKRKLMKQYGTNIEELFKNLKMEEAQAHYNRPFESVLSNKSAKESAKVFEEAEKKEVEEALKEIAEREKADSEARAKEAQARFNKPFEEKMANKDAEDSMRVFTGRYAEQSEGLHGITIARYNYGKVSPEKIKEYAEAYGFKPVNYTATFADGSSAQIIYEGFGYDITSDGKLLKKVFAGSKKTYQDVTEENLERYRRQVENNTYSHSNQYQAQQRKKVHA